MTLDLLAALTAVLPGRTAGQEVCRGGATSSVSFGGMHGPEMSVPSRLSPFAAERRSVQTAARRVSGWLPEKSMLERCGRVLFGPVGGACRRDRCQRPLADEAQGTVGVGDMLAR